MFFTFITLFYCQIRVNTVNPTAVMTDMGRMVWSGEKGEGLKREIPLRRFAGNFRLTFVLLNFSC